MKWTSLIGLLICGSVNAQSVICERFGALSGTRTPQQIFERRCPLGYKEVGEVEGSSRSGGLANTKQVLVDGIRQNIEESTQALGEILNRSVSPTVSSEQSRQQAAFLPSDSRCLEGTWELKSTTQKGPGVTLDIRSNGMVYQNGIDFISTPGPGITVLQILRLEDDKLTGTARATPTTQEFLGDTNFKTTTTKIEATRLGEAPAGCRRESGGPALVETAPRGESLVDSLKDLNELHSQGILTDEEFNAAKRRLLGL